ncbi:MAG: hypothetical protein HYZ42_09955 [Bacteroidetes bacterium]|nr:hypothetical protein [Bacteroidota bacterium]
MEVNTSTVQLGYEIKDNARSFIDKHIVPAIEQYIAGLSSSLSGGEVIQLDKLELTVNNVGRNGWDVSDLGQSIQLAFDKAVSVTQSEIAATSIGRKRKSIAEGNTIFEVASNSSTDAPKIENLTVFTKNEHSVLAWISFLNDGTTSWLTNEMLQSGNADQESLLLQSIFKEIETINKKRQLLFGKAQARRRLIQQFSNDFLLSLVTVISNGSLERNYSSVLSNQQLRIVPFILELLSDSSTQTKIRFWESVFGMLGLDAGRSFSSEVAFVLELEAMFPKAITLLKSDKSKQKTGGKTKVGGKKVDQLEAGSVSKDKVTELDYADSSIIGIRLLEWIHVLQAKPISLKNYSAIQTSVLESKGFSDRLVIPNDTKDGMVSAISKQENFANAPVIGDLSTGKQIDFETDSVSPKEKLTDLLQNDDRNSEKQFTESKDELSLQKKQPESTSLEHDHIAKTKETDDLTPGNPTSQATNQLQPSDVVRNDDSVDQSKQATETVLDQAEKTIGDQKPSSLPDMGKTGKLKKENRASDKQLFKDQEGHILVDNAGLVLLHPFLKHFFNGIGLLDENNNITDKVLATHVLHYIATGNEHDFEQTMLLEKYLVGLDPFESIPREIAISEAIKTETEKLFAAIRENWTPMKSSSIVAIRETFIQRQGKLINESPNPRLVVERKTVDILLNQLNWTISIIRLPWLDEIIFVEW